MSNLLQYFLNSKSSVVLLETFEISHPNFSKTYYIVRNAINGVTLTIETGIAQVFDYYPLQVKRTGASDDLDQSIEVQLGDLGEIIPLELDLVAAADGARTKPTLKFRSYRSDDLAHVLDGPYTFEVRIIVSKKEGSAFQAAAPRVNQTSTGKLYTVDRFPMLAGFL